MKPRSSIYCGWVSHSRCVPRPHRFRYSVWWMLVDLDELPELDRSISLFSHNRSNVFTLRDSDFGQGQGPLRGYVEDRLAEANISNAAARIELLTIPRICGYAFNPINIYFCRDPSDRLAATIYEVHNTFGERHSYVIEAHEDQHGIARQIADKSFYVSPFMDMSLRYTFRVRAPGDSVSVNIVGTNDENVVIHATLSGKRRPLTTASLLRHFAGHPLLALKVIGAIHWEALRIWRKGIGIRLRIPRRGHAATSGYSEERPRRQHV